MIIDLDKLNAGTWFTMEGGGEVCVRVCAGDDYLAIRDQVVKVRSEVVFDPKTRIAQKIKEEHVNERELNALLWDFCIVDWRNLLDKAGQPIPCTREMKLLLMGKSPTFFRFISESLDKLREIETAEQEAREKN